MTPTLCDLIETCLTELRQDPKKSKLALLETGSIRSADLRHRDGDGWSTIALATDARLNHSTATSIDLDTRTADAVLASHGLHDCVQLVQADSVDTLASYLNEQKKFDFILLDTANDAQLTLHEYVIARHLIAKGGIILIDDVEPGSRDVVKGNQVVFYLDRMQDDFQIVKRSKAHVSTGVAVVRF